MIDYTSTSYEEVSKMGNLDYKIKHLPEPLQHEVEDFVDLLVKKRMSLQKKKLRMTWAGALAEYRDQFTAMELQKKSLDWWDG